VIALSSRHARWLVPLLAFALAPFVLEEVRPRRHDDCRHPDMLTLTLAIPGSKPGPRRRAPRPGRASEDFAQWTEGGIVNVEDEQNALRFWIIRAFDPGAASPRRVLREAFDPESHEVREVPSAAGPLPVHVAIDRTRSPGRLVAWAWVYDGAPTADIFPALLRAAPRRLVTGSVPVTLFLVDGVASGPDIAAIDTAATTWIADAWSHMARYCR
jgi:hypothetical protein